MRIHDLSTLTALVIAMVVVDAAWTPVVLGLVWFAPGFFTETVSPIANAVDGGQFAFRIATMIVFSIWIYRAGRNLIAVGHEDLRFSPASRIWWFAVPVASLFKPFQGMRELWNASRGTLPHDQNDAIVSAWWGLFLASQVLSRLAMRAEGTWIALADAVVGIALAAFAIALLRGIAAGQRNLAGPKLHEIFA